MQALNVTIFAIVAVSLEVGIVKNFFYAFGHCKNSLGKRVTALPVRKCFYAYVTGKRIMQGFDNLYFLNPILTRRFSLANK